MSTMRTTRIAIAAVGALVAAMLAFAVIRGLPGAEHEFTGTAYDPPRAVGDFTLVDHRGREVALDGYRGKALLVFFGFTHCPDVCPLTMQKLSRVLGEMEADTSRVRLLLVTVDPARDTPAALAEYVARFGPHAVGITGDSATLARLRQEFGVYAGAHPALGDRMEITHTPAVFGVDRAGEIRVLLPMDAPDATIARDIDLLIRS
jgi:protein SCO1/2